jgi:inhibitor of KinA sporulation pathway (predicted exonuclease)
MYLIIDFEATCWADGIHHLDNEIIEIGAAVVRDDFTILGRHGLFVKPTRNPIISPFCTGLTSISQADVDAAKPFPEALVDFRQVIESMTGQTLDRLLFCSWGHYDKNQLRKDCEFHKVPYPFTHHISLKHEFASRHYGRKLGVSQALQFLQLDFEGTLHRGVDDAYNIAKILIKEWGKIGLKVRKEHAIHWPAAT